MHKSNFSDITNKVIIGDCLAILQEIDSNTIDLVITSPPYFQQRDYGNNGMEIGSEQT